jgi:DNA-binding FrmR family transcriptional regulator
MSHTVKEKQNLLLRAKRIRGQVEALVRALDEERDCSEVLQVMSAARRASRRPYPESRSQWKTETDFTAGCGR